MNSTKPLITHVGLGDNIVQTGLAVALAEHYGAIGFPCYQQYETSVKSFFIDEPRVKVYTLPYRRQDEWGSPPDDVFDARIRQCKMDPAQAIRAGLYAGQGFGWDFTQSFYDHAGIPYDRRWSKCPIDAAVSRVEQLPAVFPASRKIFLHDDPTRGFIIRWRVNRNLAFVPNFSDPKQSILRYVGLIRAAHEIHVIDSAFFHLINSLPAVGAQLFLHQYCRWPRPRSFRYQSKLNWNYVPFA